MEDDGSVCVLHKNENLKTDENGSNTVKPFQIIPLLAREAVVRATTKLSSRNPLKDHGTTAGWSVMFGDVIR